jgi:hypothetical protein
MQVYTVLVLAGRLWRSGQGAGGEGDVQTTRPGDRGERNSEREERPDQRETVKSQ